MGRTEIAHMYLQTAYRCYQRWGALAKTAQLEHRNPWLVSAVSQTPSLRRQDPATTPSTHLTSDQLHALDTSSVVKASQAISGELAIDRLSTTLLELIIENVGAQRGYLILARQQELTVEAEGDVGIPIYRTVPSQPLSQLGDRLSVAIVRYVTRTRSSQVLGDAPESQFISDPYIATQRPRAILCAPILSAGELEGIIYLENNLTRGAFTSERLHVVQMLASQAAISLRNARLMMDLERSVEELREAKQTVEIASRAKSEFLASINHELRTPLNGVIGALELLSGIGPTEEQREYLETAVVSADQLMRIIKDTLDLSRIEVGRFELQPVEFDLTRYMDELVRMMTLSMQRKNLHFSCDITSDVPRALIGDADRLRQVLINLLGNARKFTEPGGSVSLRIDNLGYIGADHVMLGFEVADTGIGIPAAAQRVIFEPFSQASQPLSTSRQGSALGLAIAAKLVGLMGGTIEATSQLGQGSVFSFTSKFGVWATQETAVIPATSTALSSSLRILLAEDNRINQKVASRLLERDGHTVTIANNGAEAVEIWSSRPFDVILMDGQMPVMDGFAATREIRQREHDGRIPIIAITAYTLAEDVERCLTTGMDGYVSKPIDLLALRAALQSVTDRQPAAASSAMTPQNPDVRQG